MLDLRNTRSSPRLRFGVRRAFTLVELLVVIGIIAVLAGILIPVVTRVRQQAYAANTQAQITSLLGVIQAYHGDFNAYPGPFSNMQIYSSIGSGTAPVVTTPTGAPALDATKITMSENLLLGLSGGLRKVGGSVEYDAKAVGTGPGWLGTSPKKLPAYMAANESSMRMLPPPPPGGTIEGTYVDDNNVRADDSDIPEIGDRFPEPMPILYLRARPGIRGAGSTGAINPVVTDGSEPNRPGQYDLSQIAAYVSGANGNIGVGRGLAEKDYVNVPPPGPANRMHGLRTVEPSKTLTPLLSDGTADPNYQFPFDLHPALENATIPDSPKQRDSFILISAGIDRTYGTRDDITNFGSY